MASRPLSSTSRDLSELEAISMSMVPSPFTSAKSLTRLSRRLEIRGVPRERRAISRAASSPMEVPRMPAVRSTMSLRSSGS